ncbi:Glycosyltransferase, GT2 family [Mesonia phycicola]|uniref:Glycosyltransferase, GT2 family n=1 Tax=Mesonia phycicola TaxID=579105 RepID=A0A1M6ALP7_9FLAO|nr:glycosyltransferase family A protein [Mesonia phycicola]SHI37420.1 Glycosyltransferase, GT2 family [Mesonia phycicola]
MIFLFLKYLQPAYYFGLFRYDGSSAFSKINKIPLTVIESLEKDNSFSSDKASEYDLSWQALQKGFISQNDTYSHFEKLPIEDEYRFIHKYFHPIWCFYVLCIRLLSFKNPYREISCYLKGRRAQRSNYYLSPIKYEDYNDFDSELINQRPQITIIIPTLNRYAYLKDVLIDLENQDYKNFEVIVVDQSEPYQSEFYQGWKLDLTAIHQEEKALWLARNSAIKMSKGDYILLYDDDSRVDSNWITEHIKTLDFFKADISSGVSISTVGADVPNHYSYWHISSQLDTGNVLLKKSVFHQIGLFDRQFEKQRMGDGEYGLRAYLHGFLNISNPHAKRLHLKVGSGGLREMGSWDAFRTKKWFSPRPIPSVLYLFRKYHGNHQAKLALLKTVPPSIIPYQFKKNKPLLLVGVVLSVFLFPLILFQVMKSWKLAGDKLKEGEKIEKL